MTDPANDVLPENIHPIRPQMMFVFEANTPIVDLQSQETIECRRYEMGLCRKCDEKRGKWTPWCQEHNPWSHLQWTPMRKEKAE